MCEVKLRPTREIFEEAACALEKLDYYWTRYRETGTGLYEEMRDAASYKFSTLAWVLGVDRTDLAAYLRSEGFKKSLKVTEALIAEHSSIPKPPESLTERLTRISSLTTDISGGILLPAKD